MEHTDDELIDAIRARVQVASTRVDFNDGSADALRPPATPDMIDLTEKLLGFSLPPFLRRMYSEIADGGFGPAHGLRSLAPSGDDGSSLSSTYHSFRLGAWPERVLPLWDWGDAAWSCVDTSSPVGSIITHDDVAGATRTAFTLRTWLAAWVQGVKLWNEIYEDTEATIINPFTKRPVTTRVRGVAKGTPFREHLH